MLMLIDCDSDDQGCDRYIEGEDWFEPASDHKVYRREAKESSSEF